MKLHENLFQKHALISVAYADCIADEVEHNLKSDISCDDVFRFWESLSDTSPTLKSLARTALTAPATSTLSKQVFSPRNLILNAKRIILSLENVGKNIQMIHDNYSLLPKT
jgi:hypothetical protein